MKPEHIKQISAAPVSQRFALAVKLSGIKQMVLSERSGVSPRVVSYLMKHRKPNPSVRDGLALARELGVAASLLFTDDERPTPLLIKHAWKRKARHYGFSSVQTFVNEAVEQYIDTADAYEHGHGTVETTDTEMPMALVPAFLLRSLLATPVVQPEPVAAPPVTRGQRELTDAELIDIILLREEGHRWEDIAADLKMPESTLTQRFERAARAGRVPASEYRTLEAVA